MTWTEVLAHTKHQAHGVAVCARHLFRAPFNILKEPLFFGKLNTVTFNHQQDFQSLLKVLFTAINDDECLLLIFMTKMNQLFMKGTDACWGI